MATYSVTGVKLLLKGANIMKKLLGIFALLILTCTLLLCSCNDGDVVDVDGTTESEKPTDTEATEAPTEKPTEAKKVNYWEVKCRTIKEYKEEHFAMSEEDERDIVFSLPSDWTLNKTADGYTITRDGEEIGKISTESQADRAWTLIDDYKKKLGSDLQIEKNIESQGEGEDVRFRYRFNYTFSNGDDTARITLTANYEELDANAADKLYHKVEFSAQSMVVDGMLDDMADEDYLILGNSFISSSNIGMIIDDLFMTNQKYCNFNAISRGYASVATYIADYDLMSRIERGDYKGVFICGFYAEGEADNLVVLEKACKKSNTRLVIFPAHNEFEGPINLAQTKCPELPLLNWKGELDMLIDSGVDKWELCWNDQHLHSTEYAGLIGAIMIYRAFYGEMPKLDNMSSIDMVHARELFGSYLETGKIERDYTINYFN